MSDFMFHAIGATAVMIAAAVATTVALHVIKPTVVQHAPDNCGCVCEAKSYGEVEK